MDNRKSVLIISSVFPHEQVASEYLDYGLTKGLSKISQFNII